jgi:hypothetical protein
MAKRLVLVGATGMVGGYAHATRSTILTSEP